MTAICHAAGYASFYFSFTNFFGKAFPGLAVCARV